MHKPMKTVKKESILIISRVPVLSVIFWRKALRNKVIEGIQKMDRAELIDVDSNEALGPNEKDAKRLLLWEMPFAEARS